MSALAADAGPRFRVLGSRAAFVKQGMDPQEAALLAGARPAAANAQPGERPDGWGREEERNHGRLGAGDQWQPVVTAPGDYGRFYREMAAAINDTGDVPVNPADSILGLRVIEAAYRSAATGAVEPI
jgi:predicted dehydrogenase